MPELTGLPYLSYGGPSAAAPRPEGPEPGHFMRGLYQSGHQLAGTIPGAIGLGAGMARDIGIPGMEGIRDWGLESAQESFDKADAYSREGDQVENFFESPGQFLKHGAGYVIGQALPSLVTGGLGAKAAQLGVQKGVQLTAEQLAKRKIRGAMIGSGASGLIQEGGSIYPEQVAEGHDDPWRAALTAVPAAALDLIPELGIMKKAFGVKPKNLLAGEGPGLARRVGTGAVVQAAKEAPTEVAQSVIERFGAFKDLSGPEAMSEYYNAAALGALGGGMLGSVAGLPNPNAARDLLGGAQGGPPGTQLPLWTPESGVDPSLAKPVDPRQMSLWNVEGGPYVPPQPPAPPGAAEAAAAPPAGPPDPVAATMALLRPVFTTVAGDAATGKSPAQLDHQLRTLLRVGTKPGSNAAPKNVLEALQLLVDEHEKAKDAARAGKLAQMYDIIAAQVKAQPMEAPNVPPPGPPPPPVVQQPVTPPTGQAELPGVATESPTVAPAAVVVEPPPPTAAPPAGGEPPTVVAAAAPPAAAAEKVVTRKKKVAGGKGVVAGAETAAAAPVVEAPAAPAAPVIPQLKRATVVEHPRAAELRDTIAAKYSSPDTAARARQVAKDFPEARKTAESRAALAAKTGFPAESLAKVANNYLQREQEAIDQLRMSDVDAGQLRVSAAQRREQFFAKVNATYKRKGDGVRNQSIATEYARAEGEASSTEIGKKHNIDGSRVRAIAIEYGERMDAVAKEMGVSPEPLQEPQDRAEVIEQTEVEAITQGEGDTTLASGAEGLRDASQQAEERGGGGAGKETAPGTSMAAETVVEAKKDEATEGEAFTEGLGTLRSVGSTQAADASKVKEGTVENQLDDALKIVEAGGSLRTLPEAMLQRVSLKLMERLQARLPAGTSLSSRADLARLSKTLADDVDLKLLQAVSTEVGERMKKGASDAVQVKGAGKETVRNEPEGGEGVRGGDTGHEEAAGKGAEKGQLPKGKKGRVLKAAQTPSGVTTITGEAAAALPVATTKAKTEAPGGTMAAPSKTAEVEVKPGEKEKKKRVAKVAEGAPVNAAEATARKKLEEQYNAMTTREKAQWWWDAAVAMHPDFRKWSELSYAQKEEFISFGESNWTVDDVKLLNDKITQAGRPAAATATTTVEEAPKSLQPEAVAAEVAKLNEPDVTRLEVAYRAKRDSAEFLAKVVEDVTNAANGLIEKVRAQIRSVINKMAAGLMSVMVVFNPMALHKPIHDLPAAISVSTTTTKEIRATVPANAQAKMSNLAKQTYVAVGQQAMDNKRAWIIADKPAGMIHVFNADGSLMVQGPSLYGKDAGDVPVGDSLAGGKKITPAGKYTMVEAIENPQEYKGGRVLKLMGTPEDSGFIAIHSVYLGEPKDRRAERLASPTAADNKVSYGCINTTEDVFLKHLLPNIESLHEGLVFVLPDEVGKTAEMFPVQTKTTVTTTTTAPGNVAERGHVGDTFGREEKRAAVQRAASAARRREPLDMSLSARMKRAAQLGFNTAKRWYHGTSALENGAEFTQLAPGSTPKIATMLGSHLAADPAVANTFTVDADEQDKTHGRVFPFFVRKGKTLVVDTHGMNDDVAVAAAVMRHSITPEVVQAILVDSGYSPNPAFAQSVYDRLKAGQATAFGSQRFTSMDDFIDKMVVAKERVTFQADAYDAYKAMIDDFIANSGYDSIEYQNNSFRETRAAKDRTALIVFNRADVRSPSAAFDPLEETSPLLLASERASARQGVATEGGTYNTADLQQEVTEYIRADNPELLHVVQSIDDPSIPAAAKRGLKPATQAFTYQGKVWMIANRIDKGDGPAVFLHEVGSHIGLENLLTAEEFGRLIKRIKQYAGQKSITVEMRAALAAFKRVEAAGVTGVQAQKELLAYFIEGLVKAGVNPSALDAKTELGRWFQRVWNAFKAALTKLGVDPATLTGQDFVNLAYGAASLEMAERNRPATAGGLQASERAALAERTFAQMPPPLRRSSKAIWSTFNDWAKKVALFAAITEDVSDMAQRHSPKEFGNAVRDYMDIQYGRQATRLRVNQQVEDVLKQYDHLPIGERGIGMGSVNRYIYDSTYTQKWGYKIKPDSQVKLDPGLEQRFNALSPQGQKLVRDVFTHGYEMLQAKKKAVVESITADYAERVKSVDDEIAAIKQKMASTTLDPAAHVELNDEYKELKKEAGTLAEQRDARLKEYSELMAIAASGPYAPLKRFGDYITVAKSRAYLDAEELKDTKALEEMRKNAEHYQVQFAETLGEAEAIRDDIKAQYPDGLVDSYEKEAARDALMRGDSIYLAFHRMRGMLQEQFGDDPKANKPLKQMNSMLSDLYLTAQQEASARHSERRRMYVAGADVNMMRAFATQGRADSLFLSTLENHQGIQDSIEVMRDAAKKGDRASNMRYYNELLLRHAASMESHPQTMSNAVKRLTSVWMLATNPAFYLQQILQPAVMSLPVLAGDHSYFRSARALQRAYQELGPMLKGLGITDRMDFSKAPEDVREMLQKLVDSGQIDIGIDVDMGKWATSGDGSRFSAYWNHGDRILRGINVRVESINRVATAVAAYRLQRERGMPDDKATRYAKGIVSQTHGSYDGFNTPRLLAGPVRSVFGQFRRFQIIQVSLISRLFHNAIKGESPETQLAARKGLAFILAHTFILGGALGMPGAAAIAWLATKLFGDPDEPDDYDMKLRRAIGNDSIADLLLYGAPAAMGLNMSGKLGMGTAASILPFGNFDPTTRSGYAETVTALAGPLVGGLGPRFATALGYVMEGDYYKGLEGFMPNGIGNALKAMRFATEGITAKNRDLVMAPEDLAFASIVLQGLGLPTTEITRPQMIKSQKYEMDTFYDDREKRLRNDYAEAYRNNDSAALTEAREDWKQLQEAKKRNGLKATPLSSLLKAPMAQRKREAMTLEGVPYTKTNRRFVEGAVAGTYQPQ